MTDEPSKWTLQSFLQQLNAQEPKTDFPLWKALELVKFARTEMRERLLNNLFYEEDIVK